MLEALWKEIARLGGSVPVTDAVLVGATVVVAVLGVVVLRVLASRSAARRRVSWAVLPADEFDPAPEDVSRFGFQIGRARRAIWGWFERPASAVRLRLQSVGDGQMLYVLEGPGHARSMLRAAAYNRVELRDLGELDFVALSLRPDLPDDQEDTGRGGREPAAVRGEPPEPELDDPREDLEDDWRDEERW